MDWRMWRRWGGVVVKREPWVLGGRRLRRCLRGRDGFALSRRLCCHAARWRARSLTGRLCRWLDGLGKR